MAKIQKLTPPNADEDVEQLELSFIQGMPHATDTSKVSLAVSYKSNHALHI